jgi:hypothetical protein
MHEMPKQLKRALREVATAAYEEELRRALMPLAASFDEWRAGTISSSALTDSIHAFHNGPARTLFTQYDDRSLEFAVAHAIVTGVIGRSHVPDEVLAQLKGAIEFYEQRE